ncbi:MAG TPA: XdhC family protein [Actinomycetota bacterium]|nr:XdhC family protein [Actinomycetota bacterium]
MTAGGPGPVLGEDLDAMGRDLAERGEAFVVATVVWRRAPSSGKVGSKALITADGSIRGWIGGACAEPAVIAEGKRALAEGTPRLMFLGPPEELAEHRQDGVVSVPIACQSEGALEVYVEPVMARPHLVVLGRAPAVDALARMAEALGWRSTVVDDGGSAEDHPGASDVVTALDLSGANVGPGSFVVVATQGHYDEDALELALATGAEYVGLVASRTRAAAVLGYLRDRGVPEERLARVRAPAGLDLGRTDPREIAVAVLAELVQLRASGELPAGLQPEPTSETHEAVDPICGMTVQVATARHRGTHAGRTYYFCSAGCLRRFEADPIAFARG